MQSTALPVRNAAEIGDTIERFANTPNGGLLVVPSILTSVHREPIAALAAKYRVPAVYAYRYYVTSGGLASYGVDVPAQYRGAASYVDRILRGERPADFLSSSQPNSNWSSTSRLRQRSALIYRRHCSREQTR